MMLVMLGHYLPLRNPTTTYVLINNPCKALLNLELHSICIICVHCFILISGYFGIKWKFKSFVSLLFQLLFWAIIGYFLAKYFIEPFVKSDNDYSVSAFISQMLSWYQGRWFVSAYVCLYILSPLINAFVNQASERNLLMYLVVFYCFSSIYGWILRSQEFQTCLSTISLIGLYMVGAWLRKSSLYFVNWSKRLDLICFVICTLALTGFSALLLLLGVHSSLFGYLNPLVIIESIFLFQFFRKIEISKNYYINFLAASAFSAFLLHCHPFVSSTYNKICIALHQYDFAIIYVFVFISLLFLLSVLIDKIRVFLWVTITHLVGKINTCLAC